jgi:hypothetical protein
MQKIIIDADIRGTEKIRGLGRDYGSINKAIDGITRGFKKMFGDTKKPFDDHLKTQTLLGIKINGINASLRNQEKLYKEQLATMQQMKKQGYPEDVISKVVNTGAIQKYEGFLKRRAQLEEKLARTMAYGQEQEAGGLEGGAVGGRGGGGGGAGGGGRGVRGFARALLGGTATVSMGAASVGLTMFYTALRKTLTELVAEEQILTELAPRLVDVNTGFSGTGKQIEQLRQGIVSTAAEMGYSGREGLAVANAFTKLTDSMPDEKTIMRMSRAYGVALPKTAQDMAMLTRYAPSGLSQKTMADSIVAGIEKSGMGKRSEEFMQSVVTAVQDSSKRLAEVDPRMVTAVIGAINQTGIPAFRGMGALNVIQGLENISRNPSEGALALQTQLIMRNPERYGGKQGMGGTERAWLAEKLKDQAVTTQAGWRMTIDEIKYYTTGRTKEEGMFFLKKAMGDTISATQMERLYQPSKQYPKGFLKSLDKIPEDEQSQRFQDVMEGRLDTAERTKAVRWGKIWNRTQAALSLEGEIASGIGLWVAEQPFAGLDKIKEEYKQVLMTPPRERMRNLIRTGEQSIFGERISGMMQQREYDKIEPGKGTPPTGQAKVGGNTIIINVTAGKERALSEMISEALKSVKKELGTPEDQIVNTSPWATYGGVGIGAVRG